MADTFIPVVQVEYNQMPLRHEQGIPRFVNQGQHMTNVTVPTSVTVNGFPSDAIGQNPVVTARQQMVRPTYPTMPHVPPAAMPPPPFHQPPSYQRIDQGVVITSQSPPSPSISSTVSSMSVYEDCVSIPSASPPQQSETFFYQRLPSHPFLPSGDQPKPTMTPVKSLSVSSIPSDVGSSSSSSQWTGHHQNGGPSSSQQTSATIKPEQAMAMVNEKLRDRIATLEKKIHSALAEVTFLGDRNWRLEAHVDSLMHTLEVLGVTDIEDLTGKTLPLPMFRVKVKAGYRLGPFNRLPRRAAWSFDEDSKEPPVIDFSSDRARTMKDGEAKMFNDGDDLHLPAGTDIGLSVRQMFHYERQIEELREENHALSAKVAELMERETSFQESVKKVQDQYAELHDECEDTKAELNCAVIRLQNCDGSCSLSRSQPYGEDIGDHCSDSSSSSSYSSNHDYDYHQEHEPSRVGPYYRRARGGGAIRDGRKFRNLKGC